MHPDLLAEYLYAAQILLYRIRDFPETPDKDAMLVVAMALQSIVYKELKDKEPTP